MKSWWQAASLRILIALALSTAATASAHTSSDAYLKLQNTAPNEYVLRIDAALRDLDRDLLIDTDDDGALRWAEVKSAWPRIEATIKAAAQLSNQGQACQATSLGEPRLDKHLDDTYAVIEQRIVCKEDATQSATATPTLRYTLFAKTDAGHRGLLRTLDQAGTPLVAAVLLPSDKENPLATSTTNTTSTQEEAKESTLGFKHFLIEGAKHIAAGLDHILFLAALVLVTVFKRVKGQWTVEASSRAIVIEALRIVTAFTLTHSITLGLAAAGLMAPSPRWIESIIALSVLIAAVDNVKQLLRMPRWAMAALFGWFHGFGFAGPLQELGLRGFELAVPLLAFNLGVELGQLVILLVVLPLVLTFRSSSTYRQILMPAMSMGIATLALLWFAERSLGLEIVGF